MLFIWKRLFPDTLKASEARSGGWDSGDGAEAPQPGRGESPRCRRTKPMSSCAPGQTRFIAASPTCLRVPKACHCLPGSDPGAVARQLLRAQTCFLDCVFAVSGVLGPRGAEVGAQGGRARSGSAHKEREMSPSVFLRGAGAFCGTVHSPGMSLAGWENNPCCPAWHCWVPSNQLDVSDFCKWFLALGKNGALPPELNAGL